MISKLKDDTDFKYRTLGRDIEIYRRDKAKSTHQYHNTGEKDTLDGKWDRSIEKGDFIQVKGDKSVYNAITLSILTAYKELENKGIKTFTDFGNKSYSLLKENKNKLTLFKLESYFKEAIEKIRRIKSVIEVQILEFDVYSFDINFTVETIEDNIIKSNLKYNTRSIKSYTFIKIDLNPKEYIPPEGSLKIKVTLQNSRENGIPDKLIRFYLEDELYSYETTDNNGEAIFYINEILETKIYKLKFLFEGDTDFYPVESQTASIFSSQYRFNIKDDILYLNYNPKAEIPVFIIENGKLLVESQNQYLIEDGKIYINI